VAEPRFLELRAGLRAAGVSKRNAQRAACEIEDHFAELVADALACGASESEARRDAHATLGSDALLIRRYASRPELLAWSSRWPALWFTLVPLGCYLALSVASMAILVLCLEQMHAYLGTVNVAPALSRIIDRGMALVFLGLFPAAIAAAFGVWALRRRIPLRWPLIGIAALSVLASLINMEFVITGGPSPGYAGAGIGISMRSLLPQLGRALAVGTLAAAPLWFAARRNKRNVRPESN